MVHDALKMLPIFSCYCVKNDRTLLLFRKGKTGNKASDVYVCSENIPQQKKGGQKQDERGSVRHFSSISAEARSDFLFLNYSTTVNEFRLFFLFFYKTFLSYLYLFSE